MLNILQDLASEIRKFFQSKRIYAIIPPSLYLGLATVIPIYTAGAITLLLCLVFIGYKVIKKEPTSYSLIGFLGVLIALVFSLLTNSLRGFILPAIIGQVLFAFIALVSLFIGQSMAMWLSHLSKGWPRDWYKRPDIYPAYREVTMIWSLFFLLRTAIFIYAYQVNNPNVTFMTNLIMGTPMTILILSASYIYGIIRLRALKGPSVEEFISQKEGPWIGQRKGF